MSQAFFSILHNQISQTMVSQGLQCSVRVETVLSEHVKVKRGSIVKQPRSDPSGLLSEPSCHFR